MAAIYESPSAGDMPIWDLWMSQHYLPAVSAAGDVGLWEKLGDRALAIEPLAAELEVHPVALGVVLSLLCAMGFVVRREGRYSLTQVARTYLDPASPYFWGPVLFRDARSHPAHEQLVELLRKPMTVAGDAAEGSSAAGWESGQMGLEQAQRITAFMHAHSLVVATGAARTQAFDGVTRLLDVGGGSGVYAIAAAQRHAGLRATIMDLSAVCQAAQRFIDEGGVTDRVDTLAVDMWREAWPEGYDALFFSNIFHDWNVDQNIELARKAFAVLPSGGRIILHEQLLNDTQDGPLATASFSVLMLRGTFGKQYSLPEFRDILGSVGFADIDARHSCGYFSVVTAVKP
jgi:acetylserotonin N-methyltransferase